MTKYEQTRPLPVANRLESFWLSERDDELKAARTTPDLPDKADIVIVGSGLTGALLAYHLLKESEASGSSLKVVMVEADECCGSATARNGGHCKPITYLGFRNQAKKYGKDAANHLIEFEEAALEEYAQLVAAEGIDCDLHITRAFDLYLDDKDAESAKADFRARMEDVSGRKAEPSVRSVDDPEELERISGFKGAKWGAHFPAGHLWPYKLATALIRKSIKRGLNLQTYTPVSTIERSGQRWTVHTSRGAIDTHKVIAATNAYTSGCLPEFTDRIVPIRGAACSIRPAASHSLGGSEGPLRFTYGIRYGQGDFDYMIPRQGRGPIPGQGDKGLILGGAKSMFLHDKYLWYNNVRDDQEMPGVRRYFEDYMGKHFAGWDGDAGNVEQVWSGVLGYSSDLMPFVGEHPDKPNLFVCAGFTGHGMPRIPGCTRALAKLVLSSAGEVPNEEARQTFAQSIPLPYQLTRERLLSTTNLILASMGQGHEDSIAQPAQ